jgi:hypothetical protein
VCWKRKDNFLFILQHFSDSLGSKKRRILMFKRNLVASQVSNNKYFAMSTTPTVLEPF